MASILRGRLRAALVREGRRNLLHLARRRLDARRLKPAGNSLIVSNVSKLFHVGQTSAFSIFRYDFAPDGKRFLVMNNEAPAQSEPLTVVTNWPALLPK